MLSFTGILTIGGVALTVGLLESLLETMGKEKLAKVIKLIGAGAFAGFGLMYINDFMIEITRLFM